MKLYNGERGEISFVKAKQITSVRTRFVADRNSVRFAREKALTISFVERGFERLGLDRQAMGFSWRSYKV